MTETAGITRERLYLLLADSLGRMSIRIEPGKVKHLGDGTGSAKPIDIGDLAATLAQDAHAPDETPGVTVKQLADALDDFEITACAARVLDATLGRMAALREDAPEPDASRWPITRGELTTRLSVALDGKNILIGRDPAPGGRRRYVQAQNPDGLAAELVIAIDRQGRQDGDAAGAEACDGSACGGACEDKCRAVAYRNECAVEGPCCDRTGGPCTCPAAEAREEPNEITQYPDVDAIARILRELDSLSGESGAGYDYAVNVLRFIARRYGYQLTEAE